MHPVTHDDDLSTPATASQPHANAERQMSVVEHFEELRTRLIICLIAIVLASLLVFAYQESLFEVLQWPLRGAGGAKTTLELIITAPGEYFVSIVKVSLLGGIALSLPLLLYQLLAFIGPGLLEAEKRWAFPVVIGACVSFGLGAWFGFALLLPVGLQFLLGIAPQDVRPMLSVGKYLSFAAGLVFATGLCFELPIFLLAASRIGVVTSYSLVRYRKNVLVGAFILAAIITPSIDVFTQGLLAGAIYALFEFSILLIRITGR